MENFEFEFKVHVKTILPIVHAGDFNKSNMNDVELAANRLVLKPGKIYGEYESDVLETIDFSSVVPTWVAVSSKVATVEFLIKARVDGIWCEYISYCNGGWGLGLQNKAKDINNGIAKLSTDEFIILNSKKADAIRFKLILRRNTEVDESPKVSMVSFAIESPNYIPPTIDITKLPNIVKYDVPKLYQGAVPTIGNSICSATSTTMLLKYKGMDFIEFDSSYEHRYIAGIVRDYGNAIYGNWVYNCVAMGGYGFNGYVARMYSLEELVLHLATIGPVACSMKGQMTSDKKDYYTAGHLICIIGYEYQDGILTFISNDPNVKEVECRYSSAVFEKTWRNITYNIE